MVFEDRLSLFTGALLTHVGLYNMKKMWFYQTVMCPEDAERMANSVDPLKLPLQEKSHLGLHCLLRPSCHNS